MEVITKNKILIELINKQIDVNDSKMKLDIKSLQRISRNIEKSIFGDECVIWQGYITHVNTTNVNYINFFFNKKKQALHRLLYCNFIGPIGKNEYLKYTCKNKGKCCNINHFCKINTKKTLELKNLNNTKKLKNKKENINIISQKNNNKLIIIF